MSDARGALSSALDKVAAYLNDHIGLDALWLFGSMAAGTDRAESDIDLAALFRHRPDPLEVLNARLEITAELGRDVDLVDLDTASPILVMQVLRHGKLLVDRNPSYWAISMTCARSQP